MSDTILNASKGKPTVQSLILCDKVIEDKQTNSRSLIQLFNAISVPAFPATHNQINIFATLVDGEGEHEVDVSIQKPSGGPVFNAKLMVVMGGPQAPHDMVFQINGLPLEEPGLYIVDVNVDGSHGSSRSFTVSIGGKPLP